MTEYNYTKAGCNSGRLWEDIKNDPSITTEFLGCIYEDPSLTVMFDGDLSSGEETALDALIAAHSGEPPFDSSITKEQEYDRLLRKVEALERLLIMQTDGMIDDFVDSEGVDDAASSNVEVKTGYVRSADQSSATLVTKTIETTNVKQKVIVNKHMFEGEGEFFVSADDGATWQEVTTFGEPISLSGKKYKVKANLTGTEKLALIAFNVE